MWCNLLEWKISWKAWKTFVTSLCYFQAARNIAVKNALNNADLSSTKKPRLPGWCRSHSWLVSLASIIRGPNVNAFSRFQPDKRVKTCTEVSITTWNPLPAIRTTSSVWEVKLSLFWPRESRIYCSLSDSGICRSHFESSTSQPFSCDLEEPRMGFGWTWL